MDKKNPGTNNYYSGVVGYKVKIKTSTGVLARNKGI